MGTQVLAPLISEHFGTIIGRNFGEGYVSGGIYGGAIRTCLLNAALVKFPFTTMLSTYVFRCFGSKALAIGTGLGGFFIDTSKQKQALALYLFLGVTALCRERFVSSATTTLKIPPNGQSYTRNSLEWGCLPEGYCRPCFKISTARPIHTSLPMAGFMQIDVRAEDGKIVVRYDPNSAKIVQVLERDGVHYGVVNNNSYGVIVAASDLSGTCDVWMPSPPIECILDDIRHDDEMRKRQANAARSLRGKAIKGLFMATAIATASFAGTKRVRS